MDYVPTISRIEMKHKYNYAEITNDPEILRIRKKCGFSRTYKVDKATQCRREATINEYIDLIKQNYTVTEISRICSVPTNTVYSNLYKAGITIPVRFHYKLTKGDKAVYIKNSVGLCRFIHKHSYDVRKYYGHVVNGYYVEKKNTNSTCIPENAVKIE